MQRLPGFGCTMFGTWKGDHRLYLSQCVVCVLLYHDMIWATLYVHCSVLLLMHQFLVHQAYLYIAAIMKRVVCLYLYVQIDSHIRRYPLNTRT